LSAPDIPEIVVRRLPLYLRALRVMASEGRPVTSSRELGDRLHMSAAQIRKDLSHFGEFGTAGRGYDVEPLAEELERILNVDRAWPVALIGAGALGRAILHYEGLQERGFRIAAVFDRDLDKIGRHLGRLRIFDVAALPELAGEMGLEIGIVAVPASAAQSVADALARSGIRAILNYTSAILHVPDGVRVYDIDPVAGLQSLTYYL